MQPRVRRMSRKSAAQSRKYGSGVSPHDVHIPVPPEVLASVNVQAVSAKKKYDALSQEEEQVWEELSSIMQEDVLDELRELYMQDAWDRYQEELADVVKAE